ncbi:MAG: hypothetical protein O6949_04190 [Chloroflexi bacterium]|nr:hypothetical protein [Chloroflexota bacterium]
MNSGEATELDSPLIPKLLYLARVVGRWLTALEQIHRAAQGIDQKTMTLPYLETLKDMGASPAIKFTFPMESTSLLDNIKRGDNSS